jgi:hypothetical protein
VKTVDTKELLELLEKAKRDRESSRSTRRKPGEPKQYASVKRFIKSFGIQEGIDRVPTYVIYYTYRIKWLKEKQQNKTNKINFFRTFKSFFKMVRTGQGRYYLLNGDAFDLTREGRLEAKNYDKQETKRVKTTRKRKKEKNKVSKSE